MSKVEKTVQKECLGKAGDMSKFKKVDLTKLEMRIGYTKKIIYQDTMSKAFILCMVTLIICCATRLVFAKGEISRQLCDAEKIDTDKATKVDKILQKECLEKADDMSKFKNVDMTNVGLKQMMIDVCAESYGKCIDELEKKDKKLHDEMEKVEKSIDQTEVKKLKKCALDLVLAEGEVRKLLCDAEKVDTDKVTKVVECLNNFRNKRSADMKALEEKAAVTVQKECIGKAGDISKFKKVDLTKHDLKQILIETCDEAYQKCSGELIQSTKTLQDALIKVGKSTDESESKKLTKCALDVLKK
ncbi:unnamed protein product [Medioppia subpectinata]|uniref:Uncharacterized protein n=1 Tax=Medioppia subpectinata TaxID=1979941 RepID=A0A7R9PWI2_9ACAR|nr:unnamed protein product [Medioppia subpectinata]CAG2103371.1 unnamed protein product [Medioppia subpectinata]